MFEKWLFSSQHKYKYDPPIGDYLGELTNELKKGEHITVCVGRTEKLSLQD